MWLLNTPFPSLAGIRGRLLDLNLSSSAIPDSLKLPDLNKLSNVFGSQYWQCIKTEHQIIFKAPFNFCNIFLNCYTRSENFLINYKWVHAGWDHWDWSTISILPQLPCTEHFNRGVFSSWWHKSLGMESRSVNLSAWVCQIRDGRPGEREEESVGGKMKSHQRHVG